MHEENIIVDKSKAFALRIINLYKHLTAYYNIFALANQILKAEQVSAQMSKRQ